MQRTLTRDRLDGALSTAVAQAATTAVQSSATTATSLAVTGGVFAARLFLAFTWLYAGLYKVTDPGYLTPGAKSYIGRAFAMYIQTSPLKPFLVSVAMPNAQLFGWIVMLGEVAIGLGLLVGALYRVAAFFGVVLATILWLSASFAAHPYFYRSDLFNMALSGAVLLAGTGGVLALDPLVGRWLKERAGGVPRGLGRVLVAILGPASPDPAPRSPIVHVLGLGVRRRALVQSVIWAVAVVGVLAGTWLLIIS